MRYVKNNIIKSMYEVRQELPNMSIPEGADLIEYGYSVLQETEAPVQDGFYAIEVQPIDSVQTWELIAHKIEPVTSISMRQARRALNARGLLEAVDAAIANGTDEDLKIDWEYATEVRRDWDNLIAMAESLGLTELQLDEMFIAASKL